MLIVALKEMSQSGLSTQNAAEAIENFKREALLLAGLMQPNLPHIYDHFFASGHWYLVMDFIAGETLEDRLGAAGMHLPAPALEQLVMRMVSMDADKRPVSVASIKQELQNIADHVGVATCGYWLRPCTN